LAVVSSSFQLFDLNKNPADANVRQAVTLQLQTPDINLFDNGMQALVPQWVRCLNASGYYKEV
jgi:hypothetical protein